MLPMPNELPTAAVAQCPHCLMPQHPGLSCLPSPRGIIIPFPAADSEEPKEASEPKDHTIGAFDRLGLKILSDAELADAINTTTNTLMSWRALGKGPPFVKLGKRVFYRVAAVVKWIDSCEQNHEQNQ